MSRVPGIYLLLPSIPDDLDERTKNALAIRNAATTSGVCPDCGARPYLTGPDRHGFLHLTFEHDEHCRAFRDEDVA